MVDAGVSGGAAAPETLTLARLARGLTQGDLAARTGVSQAYLSKAEKGSVELAGERLEAVADALGYPTSLLLLPQEGGVVTTACVFPRKRNSLPVSVERRVRALLDITRLQAERLTEGHLPPVSLLRESPTEDGWIGPEDLAIQLRTHLGFGPGPLPDLTGALEAAGVIVVARDLGTRRLDAIGQWPADRRPLFLLNTSAPADRQRFTLAHEVGHAVMHLGPREDQEREADRFASELLMPANDIRAELAGLSMSRLMALKNRWRVSMAALIRRARDLGSINEYRYRQLNIELSAAGYRTREPASFDAERPALVAATVTRKLNDDQNLSQLAAKAHMTTAELTSLYLEGQRG